MLLGSVEREMALPPPLSLPRFFFISSFFLTMAERYDEREGEGGVY